jgi:periplasmic copper chaperone A
MVRRLLIFTSFFLLFASCAAPATRGPQIHVDNAWARPAKLAAAGATAAPDIQSMPGMAGSGPTSAVYCVIVNDGNQADTLTGVSTDAASQASVHETQIQGDIAQMVPIPSLDIPAHGRVEFKPGGYHIMLEGLKQDLQVGSTIKIALQFKNSGIITLNVPVKQGN